MKIFVSVDIEGVAGVTHSNQTNPGGPDYGMARTLMTEECNAAIEGAFAVGATEVVVADCHGEMRNMMAPDLDQRASLVSGRPRPLHMCEGIDETCDAAFFIGYHASAGTARAVIDHTFAAPVVREIRVNGVPQSEGSLNAAVCGSFGCPVVLFTGDATSVAEIRTFIPAVEGVTVKDSISRYAARSVHPSEARRRIRAGAERALARRLEIPPLRLTEPLEMQIDTASTPVADLCEEIPTVRRLGPRTIAFDRPDFVQLYRLMATLIGISRYMTMATR